MRLLLVRHGQTSWNDSGRAQGHTDIPLDATGLDQVQKLGQAFQGEFIDRVLTSDLVRSAETARAISQATQVPLETRTYLRERSFGAWEGLTFQEVGKNLADAAERHQKSAQEVRPPNGESFQDVWDRLDAVYRDLDKTDGTTAIVSHGGALSLLLAKLIKGTLDTSRAFRFGNTGITELERRPDGLFLIKRYNDTTHLASDQVLSGSLDGVATK